MLAWSAHALSHPKFNALLKHHNDKTGKLYKLYNLQSPFNKVPTFFPVKHKDFLIASLDLRKRVNLRSDIVKTKTASSVFLFF